MTYTQTFILQ